MMKNKAIFLDRDGIINKMIYNTELGIVHTAIDPKQVELIYGIDSLLISAKKMGYLLILISNQPDIGLRKISEKNFNAIKNAIKIKLKSKGISLNAEYYCFHHPFAEINKYKSKCKCRKPNTLLYKKAIEKYNIDPKNSWTLGDGVFDMISGKIIGSKTILISNVNETAYLEIFEKNLGKRSPDYVVKNLDQARQVILTNSSKTKGEM